MAYDLATVTNSGNQLLASVVSDKSSLVIDKIEVSGTQLASSTDLKSMKSISNVVKTLSANGYQKKDTSFIISTVLDNSSVTADYKAWVFGIWAHEADGGSPILMSVITSTSSPDTISKGSGTPIDYNYKFITTFSNTNSLTIQMASDTYATNDTVLHNSGDETATGTKTFQEIKISNDKFPSLVQTDGQYITLDGGNSEIVPADNSKVVHNTDMRKPANDVAGIEEVNAKQDKIGYTPADDSKVVHDNKDGTEQLNGVQVQPFNKLSDTIGGRNYALNTENLAVVLNGDPNNYVLKIPVNHDIFGNPNIIISYDAVVTNYTGGTFWRLKHSDIDGNYHTMSDSGDSNNITANGNYHIVYHGSFPSQTSTLDTLSFNTDLNATVTIKNFMLTIGSTQSSYSPAPEDKVNVSDMRKPASDVAGIEEVNAKQDKIGYTPADDSAVVHSTDMRKPASDVVGLEDVPQAVVHSELTSGVDLDTVLTPGVYPFIAASFTNYIDEGTYWGYLVVTSEGLIVTQTAYITGPAQPLYRMKSGSPALWSPWVRMANDSKVAHLSGANNFDTVPTVNNNPLLLASSLPSDLARLSHDANFTAKLQQNGQDVALANNTLARNPDTGSVSETNTFTAAQTFSIAPTIKDASTDKGDNQAATMADLKSVEKAAWHQLNDKLGGTLLYKIDQSSNRIYVLYSLNYDQPIRSGTTIADFSSIVKNIKTISGGIYYGYLFDSGGTDLQGGSTVNLSIGSPASIVSDKFDVYGVGHIGFFDRTYFTYDSLVNN